MQQGGRTLMALNNFDEFIDKTDFLQTRLLQVNSCGSERVVKYDYTILRSNGRRDYHFLYLQNGSTLRLARRRRG